MTKMTNEGVVKINNQIYQRCPAWWRHRCEEATVCLEFFFFFQVLFGRFVSYSKKFDSRSFILTGSAIYLINLVFGHEFDVVYNKPYLFPLCVSTVRYLWPGKSDLIHIQKLTGNWKGKQKQNKALNESSVTFDGWKKMYFDPSQQESYSCRKESY